MLPGRLPAGYTMLRQAGAGRYSTVLLASEDATRNEVAVKLLHLTVEDEGTRLAAHAELLSAGAATQHPCAVRVDDAGFTPDNRPYLVTQFCRGGNAAGKLRTSGPFTVEDVLTVGIRLALALHTAHRRGVLHLDVRPANILYDEQGDSLLADHGVARVLQRIAPGLGAIFDPMYSARELFGWEAPGPSADVYSLGATLYALLAGEPAYADAGRESWTALYNQILKGELPPPPRRDVPDALLSLLQRMMSAHPEGRPPLTEVHRSLRTLLPASYRARVPDLEPEPAPEPPLPGWDPADDAELEVEEDDESATLSWEAEQEMRRRNRNRLLAAVSALLVFGGVATGLVLWKTGDKGKAPPTPSPSGSAGQAQPVPSASLPMLQARNIKLTPVNKEFQVSWEAPKDAAKVAGYYVQAQSPAGDVLGRKEAENGGLTTVFPNSMVSADSCYVVITVVNAGGDDYQYAASQPVCNKP